MHSIIRENPFKRQNTKIPQTLSGFQTVEAREWDEYRKGAQGEIQRSHNDLLLKYSGGSIATRFVIMLHILHTYYNYFNHIK